jgi:hypothetical protein
VIESDAPDGITYTWSVRGTGVQTGLDAAGNTYTPTEADEGKAISVAVSFTDTHGFAEQGAASAGTVQESPTENAAISLSGLTNGNAVEGQKVTASVIESDAPDHGITYTWSVGGTGVQTGLDAAGNTYTPTEADEGKAISVAVSFTDTHDFAESGSVSAGKVQEGPTNDLVATLNSTTAQQGTTIQVTGVSDGGIVASTGLSYAWQESSDGGLHWTTVGIHSSFTPVEAQEGKLLQLVVNYADASGTESRTYSLGVPNDLTATLDATTAQQGSTIHVTGAADGGSAISSGLSYAWQESSDGGSHWTTVGTHSSYTPVAADAGDLLQVVVTYVDSGENESVTDSLGVVASAKEWAGGSHSWGTSSQWSPSGAPASSDDTVVDANGSGAGNSAYKVTVDQASAAHSLVVSDGRATVEIVKDGTLTLGGNLSVEAGTFQIDAGATLKDVAASATIAGAFSDNGTVEAALGTLEVASTSISGAGKFKIDAGSTLQLDHADSLNVVFADTGKLILLDPAHFTGTISDSTGSMIASDVVDLAGFDTHASVTYSGTTAGGAVTVREVGHTTAVLHVGANSTHWSAPVSDSQGGILIHDPPDGGTPTTDATNSVAESTAPASQGFANGSDGFVFRPHMGKDINADHFHGTDLDHIDHSRIANAAGLQVATNDDGHGNSAFIPDVPGCALSDLLKAQLSLHHSDFHFL